MNTKRPCIKDMFDGKESKYSLAVAVAKRAREITNEAEKNGEIIISKPVTLAIEDFKNDKYIILEPQTDD